MLLSNTLSLFTIFIQTVGFINFFLSVASWASIQKHIIFEFEGASSLNTFMILHWCILIILELATVFLSSSEKMGDIKHPITILFLLVSFYIFYSLFFSFSWVKQCQNIQNDFINKSNHHDSLGTGLPEKATKYLNDGQCPTPSQCQLVIKNYMETNCSKYPKNMEIFAYVCVGVSIALIAVYIVLKKFEKNQDTKASDSVYNSSLK